MTVRAQILQEFADFARDRVRLVIREEHGLRGFRYLLADGTWSEWQEPEDRAGVPPDQLGIELPRLSLEAIASAIDEFAGAATHGPTAEKILRESLEIERARVERIIDFVDRIVEKKPEWIVVNEDGIRKMGGGE